jgi:NAD(P)-dependent dehydrogenase (short-subunit alcohol dehydrogenase family)
MIPLPTVRASNAQLRTLRPITAVIAGATSGLGESALRALAANSDAPRVYIIGRSEPRATAIIADCLNICPGGTFIFLSADLSLLKNVDTVCAEILKREEGGKIDLLFMTHGYITFEGRRGNPEAPPSHVASPSILIPS